MSSAWPGVNMNLHRTRPPSPELERLDGQSEPFISKTRFEMTIVMISLPLLSEEAKTFLIEVSNDKSGVIMSFRHLGGQAIQTNDRNFVNSGDRRSVARWEAAIEELLEHGFFTPRGTKGEIFEITDKGYKYSDYLVTRT